MIDDLLSVDSIKEDNLIDEIKDIRERISILERYPPGEISAEDVERYYTFSISGDLVVDTGAFRLYNLTGEGLTISKVHIAVDTAPTGSAIIVDVNENGTTIFTTQANRPQIAISANTGESSAIDDPYWADGNYLTVDIDQIGSTIAGADLTITIIAS